MWGFMHQKNIGILYPANGCDLPEAIQNVESALSIFSEEAMTSFLLYPAAAWELVNPIHCHRHDFALNNTR